MVPLLPATDIVSSFHCQQARAALVSRHHGQLSGRKGGALFPFASHLHEFPAKACIMEGLRAFWGSCVPVADATSSCFLCQLLWPELANQLQAIVDPAAAERPKGPASAGFTQREGSRKEEPLLLQQPLSLTLGCCNEEARSCCSAPGNTWIVGLTRPQPPMSGFLPSRQLTFQP